MLQRETDVHNRIVSLAHNLNKVNRVCKADLLSVLEGVQHRGFPSQRDSELWSLLLRCCGHAMPDQQPPVRMALARRCWDKLTNVRGGSAVPVELHNEFLRCCVDNAPVEDFSVAAFLESLGETPPDERTYDLLLEVAASRGDLDQVVEVVSLMKRRVLPARGHTFNNLLRCHATRRDKESFRQTLDTMRLAKVAPTADTFCCIILGFCEAGDSAQVLETFEYARAAKVTLAEEHVLAVVRAAAHTHDQDLLAEVFRLTQVKCQSLTAGVVNLVVHLVHAGLERAACLLFHEVTSSGPPQELESSRSDFGVFLLRELIKTDKAVDLVLEVCSRLEASGHNEWATSRATEAALTLGKVESALSLMQALKTRGGPLRNHYFWPLIVHASRTHGEAGALQVLRHMQLLGVRPDQETLTDYLLPRVSTADVGAASLRLRDHGLGVSELAPAMLVTLLRAGRLPEAVTLLSTLKFRPRRRQLLRPLAASLRSSGDVATTVAVLKLLLEAASASADDVDDLVGEFLLEVVGSTSSYSARKSRPQTPAHFLSLLQTLRREKLQVGAGLAEALRRKAQFLSQEVLKAIDQISTPQGAGAELLTGNGFKTMPHPRDMSLEELECHLVELRAKNMNTRGVLRRLLQEYCRVKDLSKAAQVAKCLREGGVEFSAGMLASLLEVYCWSGELEKAEACLEELLSRFPGFSVDPHKLLDLATRLVSAGRLQGATCALERRGPLKSPGSASALSRNCRELLSAVGRRHGSEEVRRTLELLVRLRYCEAMPGPLLEAHLAEGDLPGALRHYGGCSKDHAATHALLCALQQDGAALLLAEAVAVTEAAQGRDAARAALAAAYADTGLTHRLRDLLQEGGVKTPLLVARCRRFVEEDKLQPLEAVAEALGRHPPVYTLIMQLLYRRGDRDGADALWQKLQEEDVQPEPQFVAMVTDLLQRK